MPLQQLFLQLRIVMLARQRNTGPGGDLLLQVAVEALQLCDQAVDEAPDLVVTRLEIFKYRLALVDLPL